MITNNLSTRPFYHERAVHTWLFLIALATAAATAFNIVWVVRYTRSDATLAAQAASDEASASEARAKTATLQASLDTRQLESSSAEAQVVNDLIDRRTFSWTGLLNQFETTLPDNVRITAVRPKLDQKKGIILTIDIVAKSVEDVDQFMRRLDATGVFADLLPKDEHFDDDGLLLTALQATYLPGAPSGGARGSRR